MNRPAVETNEQSFIRCINMDASLPERLASFAAAARARRPELQQAADRMVARFRDHDAGENAPKPGEPLPPFMLPDQDGRLVTLEGLLADSPVAVTFHRGHWCPFCRISTNALTQAQRQLGSAAKIVAIMPDRQEFVTVFQSAARGALPVLTDMDNAYAMSLNLAVYVGEEMERQMRSIGLDLGKFQGNDAWMVPLPGTFVVGTDGIITARFIDPDFRKRMTVEELVAALRAAR